jgi:hypothetical protein
MNATIAPILPRRCTGGMTRCQCTYAWNAAAGLRACLRARRGSALRDVRSPNAHVAPDPGPSRARAGAATLRPTPRRGDGGPGRRRSPRTSRRGRCSINHTLAACLVAAAVATRTRPGPARRSHRPPRWRKHDNSAYSAGARCAMIPAARASRRSVPPLLLSPYLCLIFGLRAPPTLISTQGWDSRDRGAGQPAEPGGKR